MYHYFGVSLAYQRVLVMINISFLSAEVRQARLTASWMNLVYCAFELGNRRRSVSLNIRQNMNDIVGITFNRRTTGSKKPRYREPDARFEEQCSLTTSPLLSSEEALIIASNLLRPE